MTPKQAKKHHERTIKEWSENLRVNATKIFNSELCNSPKGKLLFDSNVFNYNMITAEERVPVFKSIAEEFKKEGWHTEVRFYKRSNYCSYITILIQIDPIPKRSWIHRWNESYSVV